MSIDDETSQTKTPEFDDVDIDANSEGVTPTEFDDSAVRRRKRRKMYCFHCNRPEGHSNPYVGSWFYSYFIGMTFGLIHFFGPFRCQCCGRNRLMFADWINARFHVVKIRQR